MTKGEQSGWWAVALLSMVGAAAYFSMFMIVLDFAKKLFRS